MKRSLLLFALSALLAACGSNNSMLSAQFFGTSTAPAPGAVKLVAKSQSGPVVVVDVLMYGPEPALDLAEFAFGIRIANANVRFDPQMTYTQNALVAGAGQTIAIDVDGTSDPTLVKVHVRKNGGGAGNGFTAASAVVIELAFSVEGSGTTGLTLAGPGAGDAEALDSHAAPIAAVNFDAASATIRGVTTGGGGY